MGGSELLGETALLIVRKFPFPEPVAQETNESYAKVGSNGRTGGKRRVEYISVVRQHAAALMDAMVADHERSTGACEIEWTKESDRYA